MTKPRTNIVRIVGWQLRSYTNILSAIAATLIAILYTINQGEVTEFEITSFRDQNLYDLLELQSRMLVELTDLASHIRGFATDTTNLEVRFLLRQIKDLEEQQVKLLTNLTESKVDLSTIQLIADEVQDLNCAVHKCKDFTDQQDPYDTFLEVVDFLEPYVNASGFLDLLKDIYITDDKCFHHFGSALLSQNVYQMCGRDDSLLNDRLLSFCDEQSCGPFAAFIFQKPDSFCHDGWSAVHQDWSLYAPAYYFRSTTFYSALPISLQRYEYMLFVPSVSVAARQLNLVYLHVGDGQCRIIRHTVDSDEVLFQTTCSSPDLNIFILYPAVVKRPDSSNCVSYIDRADTSCANNLAVDRVLDYLITSVVSDQFTIGNLTLNILDQDYSVPGIEINLVEFSSTGPQPYFVRDHEVNVSFPISNTLTIPTVSKCYN